MIKRYAVIVLSMLCALFVYTFYRTDQTLVNQLWIYLSSYESFVSLQDDVKNYLVLPSIIIYSLPEALWILTITLSSKKIFIKVKGKKISFLGLPFLSCLVFEALQYVHLLNGRFDIWDIILPFFFWILGLLLFTNESKYEIFKTWNTEVFVFISTYALVYLAHVI